MLWLLDGVVFYVLLFATGQWRHLVPTSWDVFLNVGFALIGPVQRLFEHLDAKPGEHTEL